MDISEINHFDRAISLAKKVIQEQKNRDRLDRCYVMEHFSQMGVVFPDDEREKVIIKLYEDDGELGDLNSEADFPNDTYGARCNRDLIRFAMNSSRIYDSLKKQLAYELSEGHKISNLFMSFIAGVLDGSIARPKGRRKGDLQKWSALVSAMNITYFFYGEDFKLTRNDASTTEKSILDAVSIAAKQCGYKCSYSTLKRDYYQYRKDYKQLLDEKLINEGRAIRLRADQIFIESQNKNV